MGEVLRASTGGDTTNPFEILTATRREVDRSHEKSRKFQAAEFLTRIGVFKKVNEANLYHGRARAAGDTNTWRVDPGHNNAGNVGDHVNINNRPALNTVARYDVASKYAALRARRVFGGAVPEVYQIASRNPDARFINTNFIPSRNRAERKSTDDAILATLPKIEEGITFDFSEQSRVTSELITAIASEKSPDGDGKYLLEEDFPAVASKYGVELGTVEKIASASNSIRYLTANPSGRLKPLTKAFFKDHKGVMMHFVSGEKRVPISHEYIGSWLSGIDVIGDGQRIAHGSVGEKFTNVLLYELDDVDSKEQLEKERQERNKKFGQIALREATLTVEMKATSPIKELLRTDSYADPRKIVETAMQVPGFDSLFRLDDGNREHYTIAQHTETVLRNFEQSFADKIPASLLPLVRTALLVHDIGKGAARRDKRDQKPYNLHYAEQFMQASNYDKATTDLVLAMIGTGADIVHRLYVKKDVSARRELRDYCHYVLLKLHDGDEEKVTYDDIKGLQDLIRIVHACDGAAYTNTAITRRDDGIRYRNHDSFGSSFNKKYGLTGRRIEIKGVS